MQKLIRRATAQSFEDGTDMFLFQMQLRVNADIAQENFH